MDKKDEEKLKDKNKEKKKHHHHHHKDKDKEREKEKERETSKKDNNGKVRSIKLSDYDMGETLGTGSFGRVKIAKNKN